MNRPASALCGTLFCFESFQISFYENAKEYEDRDISQGQNGSKDDEKPVVGREEG